MMMNVYASVCKHMMYIYIYSMFIYIYRYTGDTRGGQDFV